MKCREAPAAVSCSASWGRSNTGLGPQHRTAGKGSGKQNQAEYSRRGRESHRKGRKRKIEFSRARDHRPKEEEAEGNLVVAVKTMEVSGKGEEKLHHQVLSGFEDNKCFIFKKDCHYLLAKNGNHGKYMNTLSREVLILP